MTDLNRKLFLLALCAAPPFVYQQAQTKVAQPTQQSARAPVYETRAI
jgi:hypothetical protein